MECQRFFWTSIVCIGLLLDASPFVSAADIGERSVTGNWKQIDEAMTGLRQGSVLVDVPELNRMLLVGLAKDAPFVQAFDRSPQQLTAYSAA